MGLPYEVLILSFLAPSLLIYWLIRRVIMSQSFKILFEDKSGDSTVYPALYIMNENSVSFKRSKKDKIELNKVGNFKNVFFPPLRRERWFRGKEGSGDTQPWEVEPKSGIKSKVELGREAKALTIGYVQSLISKATMSIKSQYMGMIAGAGLGFSACALLVMFFGVTF